MTSSAGLDQTFAALSDPTRRAIVERLSRHGNATLTNLASPFKMSLPAVSKHVRVLERAGLVRREKKGRTVHCHLELAPARAATDWLIETERFWERRLAALADHLERDSQPRSNRQSDK
jgi:DNA-binding transcriptional ArsR family regulator